MTTKEPTGLTKEARLTTMCELIRQALDGLPTAQLKTRRAKAAQVYQLASALKALVNE